MKLYHDVPGFAERLVSEARPSVTIRSGVSPQLPRAAWLRELFKLKARSLVHRAQTRHWLHLLNSHPAFSEYVQNCPRFLYKIYRPYLTNTLPMAARLAVLESHYRFVFRHGLGQIVAAATRAGVPLAAVEGKAGRCYQVLLRAVGTLEREGELVLQLAEDGAPLYGVAFTFALRDGRATVSVGCIQGAGGEGALEAIRRATRELHGLRPKQLLVTLVRQLGYEFGCAEMLLVSNANRVVRGAMRQGRVLADYDQLWRELGASQRPDGDFALPCTAPCEPDLAQVASKKRSEARKRHELAAALAAAAGARLRRHSP